MIFCGLTGCSLSSECSLNSAPEPVPCTSQAPCSPRAPSPTPTLSPRGSHAASRSTFPPPAPRFMGFHQRQLSATYSLAAALMVATQVQFPRVINRLGEHRTCTLGIVSAGLGIGGLALVRVQPLHSMLYMCGRMGAGLADTATAALVARSSSGREDRSRNLGLLTSTRAAARIASPLVSSRLYELSCRGSFAPGALPFVAATCCAMAVAPLPGVLRRAERAVT